MSDQKVIKLKPADGEIIEVPASAALMSHTIKDMLDIIGSDLDDVPEIPVQNVSTKTLKKVIEWCEKWKDTPQPGNDEIKDKLAETIDSWDETYLKMEIRDLYDLVSYLILFPAHR